MRKLSEAQQDVLDKMRSGWELGRSERGRDDARYWMQQGGLGRGGQTQNVSYATVRALLKLGLITSGKWSFPTIKYHLTWP